MITKAKDDLRVRLRRSRRAVSGTRRVHAVNAINRRLSQWVIPKSEAVIGVYSAVGSEVVIEKAVHDWLQAGHRVGWPRVEAAQTLSFCLATPAELVPGAMGIPAPTHDSPVVAVEEIDLLVVPALGFDRFGARLGQGGGYYDRFLSLNGFRGAALGVAFSAQIVPLIPTEATDRRVDAVVTELGVARAGQWSL